MIHGIGYGYCTYCNKCRNYPLPLCLILKISRDLSDIDGRFAEFCTRYEIGSDENGIGSDANASLGVAMADKSRFKIGCAISLTVFPPVSDRNSI